MGALRGQQVRRTQTDAESDRADANKAIADDAKALAAQIQRAARTTGDESDSVGAAMWLEILAARLPSLADPI